MLSLRGITFLVCGLLGGFLIFVNYVYLYLSLTRHRCYSLIPPIGGVIGCVACVVAPFKGIWYFCWVPLLLDPCTWCLPWLVRELVRDARSKKAITADDEGFTIYVNGTQLRRVLWSQVDFTQFGMTDKGSNLYLKTNPVEVITIPAKYGGYDSFHDYLKRKSASFPDMTYPSPEAVECTTGD